LTGRRGSVALVLLAAVGAAAPAGGCRKGKPTAPKTPATIVTKAGIEMVAIPAGEFVMGDDAGEADERPARRVRIGAFLIDRFEVTQKAYEGLVGRNPSKFKGRDRPVERVSWRAAAMYCNLRSLREGLAPCYDPDTLACDFDANGYRLPTEAEWEYACRAGTGGRYSFGDDPARLGEHAWFAGNARKATQPVGQKRPNPWSLHDVHGNVAEWCNDYYAERPAGGAADAAVDPRGPKAGTERVLRGGSWRSPPGACRSAARHSETPGFADVCFGYEAYGFRCVRRAPRPAAQRGDSR
jgi:formylglycine-generating enzyme required for sulfatase activity